MAKGIVNYTPRGPASTKKDIDFDVYAERDVTKSQVNWADVAKNITGELETIRDDRQGRKAEIQKATDESMTQLDDMGKYDNQTLMDLVVDGSNFAANSMNTQKKLMEKGLIKPHDYTKFTQNVSSGFKTFKATAEGWDKDFAEYTKRTEDGTNSSLEVYLAKQVESFGNINDMQLYTNPQTGNMALASTYVDDNGITRINEDPNSHISMQRLNALSKQRIDKVNVGEVSKVYSAELGTWITAAYDASDKSVTSIEDIRRGKDFQDLLEVKANQAIANPTHAGSILADNNLMTSDGEKYRGGSQEEFDQWAKDHPGTEKIQVPPLADETEGNAFRQWVNDTYPEKATEFDLDATGAHDNEFIKKAYESLGEEYARDVLGIEPTVGGVENPIIVMEYDQKTQRKIPKLTENQEKVAKDFVKSAIEGHLPHIEKVQQGKFPPAKRAPTAISYGQEKEEKVHTSLVTEYDLILSSDNPDEINRYLDRRISEKNKAINTYNADNEDDQQATIENREVTTNDAGNQVIRFTLSDGTTVDVDRSLSYTDQMVQLDEALNPEGTLNLSEIEDAAKKMEIDMNKEGSKYETDGKVKVSKSQFKQPDYSQPKMVGGKVQTADAYIQSELGATLEVGSDSDNQIKQVFSEATTGYLPSDFKKLMAENGTSLKVKYEGRGARTDVMTMSLNGITITLKPRKTNKSATLWQTIMDDLIKPAIEKSNKERGGGTTKKNEGRGNSR